MDREFRELLSKGAKEQGVCLEERQMSLLYAYLTLIGEWNERFNLTAISGQRDMVIRHLLDSLSITGLIPGDAKKFIDLGSGAGLPGIPVKLAKPGLEVVLLDSVGKKVSFMEEAIRRLGLDGIAAVKGRAEELGRMKEYREAFDACSARALAPLNVLLEYALPFVKVGGFFIAMKGRDIGEEIARAEKALDVLGGRVERVVQLTLPSSDIKRNNILIKKFRQIPAAFPRKVGKPSKQPLI